MLCLELLKLTPVCRCSDKRSHRNLLELEGCVTNVIYKPCMTFSVSVILGSMGSIELVHFYQVQISTI